jgi:GPH family glycoside/pentoside/hexuronide:cation symporter
MSALTTRAKVAYAAPGFALALVGIPVYVHLPKFYGDVLGVDFGVIGLAILLTRVWDAVTDPAIGHLSDRTRTRWGRRRPYLWIGAPLLAMSAAQLLAPPALPEWQLGWWFGGWLFVAFLAWTSVQIPHAALGAELTTDHHERTSLFAGRDAMWILGTLTAAAAPSLVRAATGAAPDASGDRAVFTTLAWAAAPLLLLLPWWCAAVVAEPRHADAPGRTPTGAAYREAWANRPFRTVLVAYGIGALGGALPATLILFYVEHVLRAPQLADMFLGVYFLSGFLCLPLWTRLARRVGKKRAWLAAMTVNVGAFVFAIPLGDGDTVAYFAVCVASGIGFGAGLALPSSLVADAVDYDELQSGARREGLYYGVWSIVTKLSAALGAAVALPALEWAGYVSQGPQPAGALLALRLLYAAVPCLCYGVGIAVAARFPIDEAVHRAIRDGIERRTAGLPVVR